MPYVIMANLAAVLPPQFLLQALDDDSDGLADPGLFDEIVSAAQREVDGILGKRYETPFLNPIPAVVVDATLKIVAENLYQRRGVDAEKNPWAKRAADVRSDLRKIAAGELPLTPERRRATPSATIISEASRTSSKAGRSVT